MKQKLHMISKALPGPARWTALSIFCLLSSILVASAGWQTGPSGAPQFSYAPGYQNVTFMGWANSEAGENFSCTNACLRIAFSTGRQGVYNVRPVFGNFYLNAPAAQVVNPIMNPWWVRASVEYPSNVFCLMTQNGNTNMLMLGNQVLVPDEPFNYIPPFSTAYIRVYFNASNATPQTLGAGYITEQTTLNYPIQYEYFDINGQQDFTQGGTTNANYGYATAPIAIIGQYSENDNSVGIMGSSIYSAPNALHAGISYHEGMWLLGLTSNTNNPVPMIMGAQSGSSIYGYSTNIGGLGLVLVKYCRNIILPDAVNDINNGESFSTITNYYYQLVSDFGNGRNRLWLPTPTPISTSVNNWTNDAGQTAINEATTAQLVTWIRSGPLGCNVLDVRSFCESQSNPGTWRGIGTNQVSVDGIHPSAITITNELMEAVSNYVPQFEQP